MKHSAEQRADRHRIWRLTATVVAGVLAVVITAACGFGGSDDDDDDDDDDDSMGVIQLARPSGAGISFAPDGRAVSWRLA